jgi:sugar phosphate isomerase/epimerase
MNDDLLNQYYPAPASTYASLSLKALKEGSDQVRLIEKLGLRPEIGFEPNWDDFSLKKHRKMADFIKNHFPGAAVHLPYGGLDFGRGDHFKAKRDKLKRAADAASLYDPHHLIGHPRFMGLYDSVLGTRKFLGLKRDNLDGPGQTPGEEWLSRSVEVWSAVLTISPGLLFLENTHEHSPKAILRVLDCLGERAGFCLDFGHWHHYAMGRHWKNLDFWLDLAGPSLAHAHVHDNNGEADQHLALGAGLIDYDMVRDALLIRGLRPGITIENHNPKELLISHEILAQNPLWREPAKSPFLSVS